MQRILLHLAQYIGRRVDAEGPHAVVEFPGNLDVKFRGQLKNVVEEVIGKPSGLPGTSQHFG